MTNKDIIKKLFEAARDNGGFQYIFTLLRVWGMEKYDKEPIRVLEDFIKNITPETDKSIILKKVLGNHPLFSIIWNLLNCSESLEYTPVPYKLTYPETLETDKSNNLFLKKIHSRIGSKEDKLWFSDELEKVFSSVLFSENLTEISTLSDEWYSSHISNVIDFVKTFLSVYRDILVNFKTETGYHPIGKFDVMEVLANDGGLYGFNIYFSNGTHAEYRRHDTEVFALNLICGDTIGVQVGMIDELKPMWMVGEKPLYEIGVPGKYNKTGEWKPLIYPENPDLISKKAGEFTKDIADKRVRGVLFYIMATCHHVIEFIIKSDFDLPDEHAIYTSDRGNIHIEKIKVVGSDNNYAQNIRVYDCTMTLPDSTIENIEIALYLIDTVLNRLAFRIDGKIEWFLKYPGTDSTGGVLNIKNDDLKIINEYLLEDKNTGEDKYLFDAAISWFLSGNQAENIFTKYLSYYIAFEGIAVALAEGKMDISETYGFKKVSKEERRAYQEEQIRLLHDAEYLKDPVGFINKAYFECIGSIGRKTEAALKNVFGAEHEIVKDFSKKEAGVSLYTLRHKLAHGEFTLADSKHTDIVAHNVGRLRELVHRFILRTSLGILPNNKYKRFQRTFDVAISMYDPRSTRVANDLKMFPVKDWAIRLDWII